MTAVHEDQLSWGEDIKHHPAELLSFYPPTVVSVSEKAIGNLKYDGKLLLDYCGKALRDFSSLPLVISSMVEGWRVEAWMRSDSRMKMTDILTRIPVEQATTLQDTRFQCPYTILALSENVSLGKWAVSFDSWVSAP